MFLFLEPFPTGKFPEFDTFPVDKALLGFNIICNPLTMESLSSLCHKKLYQTENYCTVVYFIGEQ